MARPRVTRPRPDGGPAIAGERPVIPANLRVQAIEGEIAEIVSQRMGERLGVAPDALPNQLKSAISTASTAAAHRAVELAVTKDIDQVIGDVTRGSVLGRFDARVDLARQGLDHIAASDDVQQIMKKRAEMLAAKKQALETAGFSSQEAMDIILADIAARGH
jgi:hypothetical protein